MKRSMYLLLIVFLLITSISLCQDLSKAISEGDIDVVKKIGTETPDALSMRIERNLTMLHLAAYGGHDEVVNYLLTKKLEVNAKDYFHNTPLHYAASKGHVEVIKILLDSGANINSPGIELSTPLHYAIRPGNLQTVKLLVHRGADIHYKDHYKYSVTDRAESTGALSILEYLKSMGGKLTRIVDPEKTKVSANIDRLTFPFWQNSNIAVYKAGKSFLLVDTGSSPKLVETLKSYLRKNQYGELELVLNSHKHWDHCAGNEIMENKSKLIDYQVLKSGTYPDAILKKIPYPSNSDLSFDHYFSIEFEGKEIQIFLHGGIHTDDDILIYFKEENVLFMGDLFLSQSFPSVSKKADKYLEFLKLVQSSFPNDTILIAGHGKEKTVQDLGDYRDMLLEIKEKAESMFNEGSSLNDLHNSDKFSMYSEFEKVIPVLNVEYWIRAVYNSMDNH